MEYNLGNVHKDMKTGAIGVIAGFIALAWTLVCIAIPIAVIYVLIHFACKWW